MKTKKIPEQLLGTCVVIVNNYGNKVLLGKRKNSFMSGYYGLPGGRLELKEKLIDCAKREIFEETGMKVDNLEYLGVIRDLQDGYTFTHFAFLCKTEECEPKLTEPEKCEGWEWFETDNIPEKILDSHKAAIDIFLNLDKPNLRDISIN